MLTFSAAVEAMLNCNVFRAKSGSSFDSFVKTGIKSRDSVEFVVDFMMGLR